MATFNEFMMAVDTTDNYDLRASCSQDGSWRVSATGRLSKYRPAPGVPRVLVFEDSGERVFRPSLVLGNMEVRREATRLPETASADELAAEFRRLMSLLERELQELKRDLESREPARD